MYGSQSWLRQASRARFSVGVHGADSPAMALAELEDCIYMDTFM